MDFITEGKNPLGSYITSLEFPTVFKDNPQYDSFMLYTMMRRGNSSNYTNMRIRFVDDSGTHITAGYYHLADNRVGTYVSKGQNTNVGQIDNGTMGTNNNYDNVHTNCIIGNPYVSGKLTTFKNVGGGNYQGSSSTYNNGAMQLFGNMGWIQDTQLVAGIVIYQSGTTHSETCFTKIFGIKTS